MWNILWKLYDARDQTQYGTEARSKAEARLAAFQLHYDNFRANPKWVFPGALAPLFCTYYSISSSFTLTCRNPSQMERAPRTMRPPRRKVCHHVLLTPLLITVYTSRQPVSFTVHQGWVESPEHLQDLEGERCVIISRPRLFYSPCMSAANLSLSPSTKSASKVPSTSKTSKAKRASSYRAHAFATHPLRQPPSLFPRNSPVSPPVRNYFISPAGYTYISFRQVQP